ncbi:MAG: Gmad2 immunoglobulin-like domain-containing protein, partial [Caldisericaceae bacterium]
MKRNLLFLLLVVGLLLSGCSKAAQNEVSIKSASVNTNGTIHIEGSGRAFESTIGVKIVDGLNNNLYEGPVVTNASDMSKIGDFVLDASLRIFPQTDTISVECFVTSPKDGSITASDTTIVNYNVPFKKIEVYYGNTVLNKDMIDCTKVFPVARRISENSKNPVLDSVMLLINGPTKQELTDGYFASTPNNLTVNFVKETGNSIQVDFGKELMDVGGGSCKVGAIRAEITRTVNYLKP